MIVIVGWIGRVVNIWVSIFELVLIDEGVEEDADVEEMWWWLEDGWDDQSVITWIDSILDKIRGTNLGKKHISFPRN